MEVGEGREGKRGIEGKETEEVGENVNSKHMWNNEANISIRKHTDMSCALSADSQKVTDKEQ